MGLSYKDVALLNDSINNLGHSMLQNRVLDEQMKQREEDRKLRERQMNETSAYRKTATDEQARHNKAMEDRDTSRVDVWLQDPKGGGTFNFKGPKTQYDSMMGMAEKAGSPLAVLPNKPAAPGKLGVKKFVGADGAEYTFNINSEQDSADAEKIGANIAKTTKPVSPGSANVATVNKIMELEKMSKDPKVTPEDKAKIELLKSSLEKTLERAGTIRPERPYSETIEDEDGRKVTRRMTAEEYQNSTRKPGATSSGTGSRFKIIGTK